MWYPDTRHIEIPVRTTRRTRTRREQRPVSRRQIAFGLPPSARFERAERVSSHVRAGLVFACEQVARLRTPRAGSSSSLSDNRKLAIGSWQSGAGNRKLTIGSWQSVTPTRTPRRSHESHTLAFPELTRRSNSRWHSRNPIFSTLSQSSHCDGFSNCDEYSARLLPEGCVLIEATGSIETAHSARGRS